MQQYNYVVGKEWVRINYGRESAQGQWSKSIVGRRELQLFLGVGSDTMSGQAVNLQSKIASYIIFLYVGLYYIHEGETIHFISQ